MVINTSWSCRVGFETTMAQCSVHMLSDAFSAVFIVRCCCSVSAAHEGWLRTARGWGIGLLIGTCEEVVASSGNTSVPFCSSSTSMLVCMFDCSAD